ncbi:hypothetical protein [Geminicoccus roseus]|uniref:hypothetical protein n=1 Tax=Geminicoccus roseus TaxID=404900 RepID=UPI000484414E|nr:hypothetical protein [Geminicoccus roseus]
MNFTEKHSNDNTTRKERLTGGKFYCAIDVMAETMEIFERERIPLEHIRYVIAEALMKKCVVSNPYREPPDINALKNDFYFLLSMHSRISFMYEEVEKALDRAGISPFPE